MNLQEIKDRSATYATKAVAKAALTAIKETAKNDKGNITQTIEVADSSGKHIIYFKAGNGQGFSPDEIGTWFGFECWTKKSEQSGKTYVSAVLGNPNALEPPPDATHTIQQATTQAQSSDNERLRSMCLSYAKDLAAAKVIELGAIKGMADEFLAYIANKPVHQVQQAPPQTGPPEEDIPW